MFCLVVFVYYLCLFNSANRTKEIGKLGGNRVEKDLFAFLLLFEVLEDFLEGWLEDLYLI